MTVPIAEGSVDEVHTLVDRPAERPQRLVVVGPEPHGLSDPPGAVTELGHLQTCLAQAAVVHGVPPAGNSNRGAGDCSRPGHWAAPRALDQGDEHAARVPQLRSSKVWTTGSEPAILTSARFRQTSS